MDNKFILLNDVSYGSHERQKADIFITKKVKTPTGFILFIHGGGWHDGDKKTHYADAEFFCNLGYICGTMNYRFVSEELSVFDELDDISSALEAIKAKCAEYGFNIEKIDFIRWFCRGASCTPLCLHKKRRIARNTCCGLCILPTRKLCKT